MVVAGPLRGRAHLLTGPGIEELGVEQGGLQALLPQTLAHGHHAGPAVEQLGGMAVAQLVAACKKGGRARHG